jgi:ketosteroid isomerase-like protein
MSYDSASAVIRRTLPSLRELRGGFDTIEVTALGPDVALASTPFHESFTDTVGATTRVRGVTTWLWRRTEGRWRIAYIHAAHYPDTEAR